MDLATQIEGNSTRRDITDEELEELEGLISERLIVPEKFKKLVPNFAKLNLKKQKISVRPFRYCYNPNFEGAFVQTVNECNTIYLYI